MSAPLLIAEGLSREFPQRSGFGFLRKPPVRALSDFDLTVATHEAVGLVGESGSGKSTAGRLLLGLAKPTRGSIVFDGTNLATADPATLRRLRRRMQLVFQDPHSSLDPRRRVGAQIADGLAIHDLTPPRDRPDRVRELLAQVGLDAGFASRFPHAFSGGQRQRIGIARALSTGPDFLVADEPVSALDLSVQAQVLALFAELRSRLGLALVFISHDLAAVRQLCDRVVVLYLGRIMEEGPAAELFARPRHPYTRALLGAAPSLKRGASWKPAILAGEPPSPANPPSGCVFRTRCPHAAPVCAEAVPQLAPAGSESHKVACVRLDAIG